MKRNARCIRCGKQHREGPCTAPQPVDLGALLAKFHTGAISKPEIFRLLLLAEAMRQALLAEQAWHELDRRLQWGASPTEFAEWEDLLADANRKRRIALEACSSVTAKGKP